MFLYRRWALVEDGSDTAMTEGSQSHASEQYNSVSRFTSAQMCILVVGNNSKSTGRGVTARSCFAWDLLTQCVVRNTTARTQPLREPRAPQMAFLLCPEQSAGQSFCLINHSGTRAHMTKQSKALHNYFVCLLDVLMKNTSSVLLEALSEIYSVGLRRGTQDVATVLTSMEFPLTPAFTNLFGPRVPE